MLGRKEDLGASDLAMDGMEAREELLAEMDSEVVVWNYGSEVRTEGEYWREELWSRIGGKELVALPWRLPTRTEMAGVCQLGYGQEVVAVGTELAENRWWKPETAIIAGGGRQVLVISDDPTMSYRLVGHSGIGAKDLERVWGAETGGVWVMRPNEWLRALNEMWFEQGMTDNTQIMLGYSTDPAVVMEKWFEKNGWPRNEDMMGLIAQVARQPGRMLTDMGTGEQFWTLGLDR